MPKQILTQDELKSLLRYDPETGVLTWLASRGSVRAGAIAGGFRADGYCSIALRRKRYLAHRLAFLYMTGEWPRHEIDHIDHNPSNNRWINLRDVSHEVNLKNCRRRLRKSKSGHAGVDYDKVNKKYRARVYFMRKPVHLGRFDTLEDAVRARKNAEERCGYHENSGQK